MVVVVVVAAAVAVVCRLYQVVGSTKKGYSPIDAFLSTAKQQSILPGSAAAVEISPLFLLFQKAVVAGTLYTAADRRTTVVVFVETPCEKHGMLLLFRLAEPRSQNLVRRTSFDSFLMRLPGTMKW